MSDRNFLGSSSKSEWYKDQKNNCFKSTTTDNPNFDKWCSDDHCVSFLFYYHCTCEDRKRGHVLALSD